MEVTNILIAETMPKADKGTFKSTAIEEKSGGNSPIIMLSKAANITKTNIV